MDKILSLAEIRQTIKEETKSSACVPKLRSMIEEYGLSWRDCVKNGIPLSVIVSCHRKKHNIYLDTLIKHYLG